MNFKEKTKIFEISKNILEKTTGLKITGTMKVNKYEEKMTSFEKSQHFWENHWTNECHEFWGKKWQFLKKSKYLKKWVD